MRQLLAVGAIAALAVGGTALGDGSHYHYSTVGIESFGSSFSPGFTTTIDLAAGLGFASGTPLIVNGVGWDVVLTAFAPSILSEMAVELESTVFIRPGYDVSAPGTKAFSSGGVVKFSTVGIPNITLPNGMLTLTFYETFDDHVGPDGIWKEGTITIQVREKIPAPGATALLGIAGLFTRRRRGESRCRRPRALLR